MHLALAKLIPIAQPKMIAFSKKTALILLVASSLTIASSFTPKSLLSHHRAATSLKVAVDPEVVSKKDYDSICGIGFESYSLQERLEKANYLYPKHVEVIQDFDDVVNRMIDNVLLDTGEHSWQPQDYLPDLSKEGWLEEVQELRGMAAEVPDELLVVLIGDMVTEEALPTYQTLLNTFEGCDDPTGTTESAWARWSRGWTSEENRHGDLLNKYLYLGGRTDMRSIEVTIQHLITSGFNPGAEKDGYRGFVYTSFQERATKVSHGNVGRLARQCGDTKLAQICAKIAGDEARHERAYQTFVTEILKRDPNGLLKVFGDIMRGQIVMPAELMTDGLDAELYENFSNVAQRLGVYTAIDYAEIVGHLVKIWDLEHIEGLSSEGEKERDYLCNLPRRYMRLAERSMQKKKPAHEEPMKSFNWIYGREV